MSEKKTIQGSTDIQGNANISRSVNVGGNANIQGSMRVGHNLKVDGWLEARNIKGPLKGLFATEGALRAAYPRPQPGWYALVGDTLPAAIYRAEAGEDGKIGWETTGETGGEFNVYLDQLETDVEEMRDEMLEVKDKAQLIEDIGESVEAIEERLKKDAQGEVKLSDIGEVSARHTTNQLPSVWRVMDGDHCVGVMIEYSDPYGHSVAQVVHTTMVPGESGCLIPSQLDEPARIYSRTWCRQKETWSAWEESARQSEVANIALSAFAASS